MAILDAPARIADDIGKGVADIGKSASNLKDDITRELSRDLAKAGKQVRLDERIDDAGRRIRSGLPKDGIDGVVSRLQRELPDTDRDRYDRAFQRGWSRARSSYVGVGVVVGILGGIVGALLLDPAKGEERRRHLSAKVREVTDQVSSVAGRQVRDLTARAKHVVEDRGVTLPGQGGPADGDVDPSRTRTTPVTAISADDAGSGMTAQTIGHDDAPRPDLSQWDAIPADAPAVPNAATIDARTPIAAGTISAEGHEALAGQQPGVAGSGATEGDRGDWHRTI